MKKVFKYVLFALLFIVVFIIFLAGLGKMSGFRFFLNGATAAAYTSLYPLPAKSVSVNFLIPEGYHSECQITANDRSVSVGLSSVVKSDLLIVRSLSASLPSLPKLGFMCVQVSGNGPNSCAVDSDCAR